MRKPRVVAVVLAGVAGVLMVSSARAQFENSVWPGFKGRAEKRASVTADGPATVHAFTKAMFATVSTGGFTVGADGSVYFKSHFGSGTTHVYRLDGAGNVLATSPNIGGAIGGYAGVAVGVDAVYTSVHGGGVTPAIVRLDKSTLAVLNTFTNPAFGSLRGTPLISETVNNAGHHNLYVHDRLNKQVHAVDSMTGTIMWTYTGLVYDTYFGQLGPMWRLQDGRQAFAHFENGDLGPGHALADNGDGTFQVLWSLQGPENFNWFGSGALSEDGQRIYVTTFNDNDTPSLWAIKTLDGSIVWSVPGMRGTPEELNFFGRPAVVGNRVYCGGGLGVIAAFDDQGGTYARPWTYRDTIGEFTAVSAVKVQGDATYVYAVRQEAPADLVVLKDNGATYTVVHQTSLNGTMRNTLFGNNSATIDGSGGLWIAGGRHDDPTVGDIYKFEPEGGCYPDCDGNSQLNVNDYICFQTKFALGDPYADCDGNGQRNVNDYICFQTKFALGC